MTIFEIVLALAVVVGTTAGYIFLALATYKAARLGEKQAMLELHTEMFRHDLALGHDGEVAHQSARAQVCYLHCYYDDFLKKSWTKREEHANEAVAALKISSGNVARDREIAQLKFMLNEQQQQQNAIFAALLEGKTVILKKES